MRLRNVLFWVLLAAVVVLALLHLDEIGTGVRLLRTLRWEWLVAAGAAQFLTYLTTALALQGLLATLGYRAPTRALWRPAVAFVLGAQTVPTAGAGGLVLWSMGLGQLGIPHEGAIASGTIYTVLDYVAFFVLLAAAVVVLLIEHSLPRGLLISLVAMSATILVAAMAAALLLRRESRGLAVVERVVSAANRFLVWRRRSPLGLDAILASVRRLYADWRTLGTHWRRIVAPAAWVVAARLLDVVTLQVLFIAAGHRMAWGALTLGLVYANFASVVSILPTGLGALDASLALLYAAMGAPLAASVVVTLLFRVIAYWLPIPYGIYVYHRLSRPRAAAALPRAGRSERA